MVHVFIINHFAGGNELAKNLRSHLAEKKGLRYFVFNTVRAGFETEIVRKARKFFEDEKLRFYCCGGSGTLRNMLNGLENFKRVEFAFYPCGMTNDFLKCFGDDEAFRDIDKLIEGKTVEIDYIKTNFGVALNTLSVGFDSNVENAMRNFRIYNNFGKQIPYILSVLYGIVLAKPKQVELVIDGEIRPNKYSEIVFANGCVLGGNLYVSAHTNIMDGMASYFTASDVRGLEAFPFLIKIMQKKLTKLNHKVKYGECKSIEIRSLDGKPLLLNYDGELVECGTKCKAEIVYKGLRFVIPQTVNIKKLTLY